MNKELKFLWVDDEPQRKRAADSLKDELGVDMTFICVEGENIDTKLNEILSTSSQPDLIIMDHILTRTSSETFKRGSTAATVIHEKWPECPIVSVTAVDLKSDVDTRQRSAYENMFRDYRISEHYQTILSIANGFGKLRKNRPKDINALLNQIDCPMDDREKIRKILPIEIKEEGNLNDESFIVEVYRWFNSVLAERPGFLYNKKWAATYMGLSEDGFNSVSKLFEPAKYQGIFSDSSNERWWKSQLTQIIAEKTGKVGLPWKIGRELVASKASLYSKCYSSKKEFPETVAAMDESVDTEWHAMRLEETEPHPNYEDMLFFEQLRIMK